VSVRNCLSRRAFLRLSALGASALVAACAPKVVEKVVKETVVVEKAVEKVVKETVIVAGTPKVVEKVVTQVVEVAPKTAEEILTPLGLMPGSPDHAKGWKTLLPDLPRNQPASPPPVVITTSRRVEGLFAFPEGEDLENNHYTRMMKELFGVEYKVAWTCSRHEEKIQKYNLAMASGDLPDVLETVPDIIFAKMVEANLLEDLTEAWDMYAHERWKASFSEYGKKAWVWGELNGRKMGIPRIVDAGQEDALLWYREDWLEQLGLDVPSTLEELHDVALAITEADIGQGAPGTTVGLLACKFYWHAWIGSLCPIWGGMGTQIRQWWESDGKLAFNGVRPEARDGLALLRQWYADGVLQKDFYTRDCIEAWQYVHSNQCGLHLSCAWGRSVDSVENDPSARWKVAGIPSGPAGKSKETLWPFYHEPMCCRKGFEHVDKWFQTQNWIMELKGDAWRRMHGWEGVDYEWEGDKVKPTDVSWSHWAVGPMGTAGGGNGHPLETIRNIKYKVEEWGKIPAEKRDAQMNLFFEDPTGTNDLLREALFLTAEENVETGRVSELMRPPTPTQVERQADLTKLQDETFLGIITGEKPLEAFDDFVDQWKEMGGDKITEEANEWWESR